MDNDYTHSLLTAIGTLIGDAVGLGDGVSNHPAASPEWSAALAAVSAQPSQLQPTEHVGIASIRDADPAFDLAAFLVRVGEMFSAYHEAADKGDLASVRRFVDETAYMSLEPAVQKAGRRAEGPRAFKIRTIQAITARHDDGLDLVRVLITAEQSGSTELICEYWELVRARGTQTKPGLSLTKCPNCGGPVDGLDPTRCAYCGTRLADPALDWVVRKISAQ